MLDPLWNLTMVWRLAGVEWLLVIGDVLGSGTMATSLSILIGPISRPLSIPYFFLRFPPERDTTLNYWMNMMDQKRNEKLRRQIRGVHSSNIVEYKTTSWLTNMKSSKLHGMKNWREKEMNDSLGGKMSVTTYCLWRFLVGEGLPCFYWYNWGSWSERSCRSIHSSPGVRKFCPGLALMDRSPSGWVEEESPSCFFYDWICSSCLMEGCLRRTSCSVGWVWEEVVYVGRLCFLGLARVNTCNYLRENVT